MNTSRKQTPVDLDKLEQTLENLLKEAKATGLPNAHVSIITDMSKVIRGIRAARVK